MNATNKQFIEKLNNADAMYWNEGIDSDLFSIHFEAKSEYFSEDTYLFVNNGYEGTQEAIEKKVFENTDVTYDDECKTWTVKFNDNDVPRTVKIQFLYVG